MHLSNPHKVRWRTDKGMGRNIYALASNDETQPSDKDPLIGTVETSDLAEMIVMTHNYLLNKYSWRYYLHLERL